MKTLPPAPSEDPILKPALREVEKNIEEAGRRVAEGKRKEAHEALEGIRTVFAESRKGLGIDYLPDRLTAFHNPMEEFYLKVSGSQTQKEWSELHQKLDELFSLLNEVERRTSDPNLFDLTRKNGPQWGVGQKGTGKPESNDRFASLGKKRGPPSGRRFLEDRFCPHLSSLRGFSRASMKRVPVRRKGRVLRLEPSFPVG